MDDDNDDADEFEATEFDEDEDEAEAEDVPDVGDDECVVGGKGEAIVTVKIVGVGLAQFDDPNAESAEFSRECVIGDFDPVGGGVKNELGSFRIRKGIDSGLAESGFKTLSNNACKSESESSPT